MLLTVLGAVARHGRLCLVAGLLAGLLLPQVALAMRPWLPELVAFLLFLTAFRIGPSAALGSLQDARRGFGITLIFQLAMPLVALALFTALGVAQQPLAVAVVLMLSASSISGAPNFAILMGHDPAPGLRLLILGTALLPLTVLPVLWAAPSLGDAGAVFQAAGNLFLTIAAATVLGFGLRHWALPAPAPRTVAAVDGITAIALAVIVVGLMSALGPALRHVPLHALSWLAAVMAINFGLQIACYLLLRHRHHPDAVPISIIAGNRNIALFLVALPASVTDPLLLFIGCYQVPMYLTPILLRRLYAARN